MHLIETPQSPRLWEPVELTGNYVVDWDMAYPVMAARPARRVHGVWLEAGQVWNERINDLSPLPPESHFRAFTLRCARKFVEEMAKKRARYQLVTQEGNLVIRGPYQHRDTVTPKPVGFQQDEILHPECLDFHITGTFLAEYGHLVEWMDDEAEAQKVQAVSFDLWREAERIAREKSLRNH
jgi:hypothetical protein